jgi:hypothetical protein
VVSDSECEGHVMLDTGREDGSDREEASAVLDEGSGGRGE